MQDMWSYALGNYGAYNVWSGLKVYFYTDPSLALSSNTQLSDVSTSQSVNITSAINLDALSGPLVNGNGSYGAGQDVSATVTTFTSSESIYGAWIQQNDGSNDYLFAVIPFMDSSGNDYPVTITQVNDFIDLQLQLPFAASNAIS